MRIEKWKYSVWGIRVWNKNVPGGLRNWPGTCLNNQSVLNFNSTNLWKKILEWFFPPGENSLKFYLWWDWSFFLILFSCFQLNAAVHSQNNVRISLDLENVMKTLGRWYGVEFHFIDERAKEIRIGARFGRYDDMQPIVDMIKKTNLVEVLQTNRCLYISEKKWN